MSVDILGKIVTSAEARFSIALRPRKPWGSLGRKAQDGYLDFHTAPELWDVVDVGRIYIALFSALEQLAAFVRGQKLWEVVIH